MSNPNIGEMWKKGMPQTVRDKISAIKKKQFQEGIISMPNRTGLKSWNSGSTLTPQHKMNISRGIKSSVKAGKWHQPNPKGSKLDKDHRTKISLGRSGIPAWNKGKFISKQHRENIRKSRQLQEQKKRGVTV